MQCLRTHLEINHLKSVLWSQQIIISAWDQILRGVVIAPFRGSGVEKAMETVQHLVHCSLHHLKS